MKMRNMKNLIKIVALILAIAFCLQIASVFAMEPVNPKPSHFTEDKKKVIGINPASAKLYLWDVKGQKVIKEFPLLRDNISADQIVINSTGTKIAVEDLPAGITSIRLIDVATGNYKFDVPSSLTIQNFRRDNSLLNKILQHKMTKLVGVCALGAGVVSLVGYAIWKLVGKPKESKPNPQPIKVLRHKGG